MIVFNIILNGNWPVIQLTRIPTTRATQSATVGYHRNEILYICLKPDLTTTTNIGTSIILCTIRHLELKKKRLNIYFDLDLFIANTGHHYYIWNPRFCRQEYVTWRNQLMTSIVTILSMVQALMWLGFRPRDWDPLCVWWMHCKRRRLYCHQLHNRLSKTEVRAWGRHTQMNQSQSRTSPQYW